MTGLNKLFLAALSLLISIQGNSQKSNSIDEDYLRIVFYNVENLFDIYDDSLTRDEEFTPEGIKRWNNTRFYTKLNNIYRVIISIGEWEPPAIIGLCEVENRFALNKLIYDTPLKKYNYKVIHVESPDQRGIDVALLYRHEKFKPMYYEAITITFPFDPKARTRDILYIKGLVNGSDSLNLFVNHWPSRYGGQLATKPKRDFVASVLKSKVDSLFIIDSNANVLIMGDFNDDPSDESLNRILNAKSDTSELLTPYLFNLMSSYNNDWETGTLKYKENWNIFDQFIVSGSLLTNSNRLKISEEGVRIFNTDYLVEEDRKYLGAKPYRTYSGPRYNGGYSDHLPVYLDLIPEK